MQLKTKPKGHTNRVGVIEATDNRRLKKEEETNSEIIQSK